MTACKLSDETLNALGATAGDAEDKIKALISANAQSKTDLEAAKATSGEWSVKINALEDRVKAVEARKVEVSADQKAAILTEAKEAGKLAGAEATSAAIAKAGVGAVSAGKKEDDKAEQVDPSDPKARWAADANLRDEFITEANWLAYAKAESQGRVKLSSSLKKG
jgi:hypothetical protein